MQFVDLHQQYLSIKCEIDEAIQAVIRESSFIRGPHVESFETNFAASMNMPYCISCANGTDAIYIAMKGLGLQPGDEVITTAHSWIATSETVTQAGGKVVFCDTEADYFTIDTKQIESKITPRTKGIIPVHLYGQPADMDEILRIAKKYNLWVIEDCAQSHYAMYKGRMVGTMGDAATFSFYPGKNLGAMGDAGAIVTKRKDLAEFAALYARHGGKGDHLIEGINSRLDGLQAAILNVKLKYIHRWTELRQAHATTYNRLLSSVDNITTPKVRPECSHVYHLYVIRTERRDECKAFLEERGVPSVINYARPLPLYLAYKYLNHTASDFPVASHHADRILSIPIYPEMTLEDQRQVTEALKAFAVS